MKLTIEIKLGNDAMQTLSDVVGAMQRSQTSLVDGDGILAPGDRDTVRDENGNTVGGWWVAE